MIPLFVGLSVMWSFFADLKSAQGLVLLGLIVWNTYLGVVAPGAHSPILELAPCIGGAFAFLALFLTRVVGHNDTTLWWVACGTTGIGFLSFTTQVVHEQAKRRYEENNAYAWDMETRHLANRFELTPADVARIVEVNHGFFPVRRFEQLWDENETQPDFRRRWLRDIVEPEIQRMRGGMV